MKNLPADFPEKSKVSPLADVMIQIDERFDNLKLIKKSGYQKPASHPDLDPAHEAVLLSELFQELQRSPIVEQREADFKAKLDEAVSAAKSFQALLADAPLDGKKADDAIQRVTDSCAACHKAHRN